MKQPFAHFNIKQHQNLFFSLIKARRKWSHTH